MGAVGGNGTATTEIRLTELLGRRVVGPGGLPLGRLADVTTHLAAGDAVVDDVVVRDGRTSRVVPWAEVRSIDGVVELTGPAPGDTGATGAPTHGLLLARDVLDTQVIDLDGRRLARVGEVVLRPTPSGRLAIDSVDTGFGAVCRRLGFTRLGRRLGERTVQWSDLHLTSTQGHAVQLASPAATLHRLDAGGVGLLLDAVDTWSAVDIVRGVHPDVAAGALAASHPATTGRVARHLRGTELRGFLDRLPSADAERVAAQVRRHPTVRRLRRHDGWRRRVPTRRSGA